ncbi:MAG TPA: alcohol dehydrogenase catalytic domain-containing protein [Solirubrobacteraceae bacterium]|nr:alcohol dehydrogenase catalytic domain-containing protein [Solirubrobacteraceae bacterium]
MRALTFQGPGEVRIEERPMPELTAPEDAVVRIDATGVCGSDLHIYHGRLKIEPGFTIGHEYVGTVVEAGDAVTRVAVGDRVAGCFQTACGTCFHCMRGEYQRCVESRSFGLGATMGSLQGTQAEYALVPRANLTLQRVPDAVSDDVALFAGDVMGTGYHGVASSDLREGETAAVLGLGPVGLCAVQAAKLAGARVLAIDSVEQRLAVAESFGAIPLHLTEQDVKGEVKKLTEGRGGVDVSIDAVGHTDVLDMAIRLTRACGRVQCVGIYAERGEIHLGLAWLKSLTVRGGQANVIAHLNPVLEMLADGRLDPTPLVTHHMKLQDAPEAYEIFDRREALKIVLTP